MLAPESFWTNHWMNNPEYLAQTSHFFAGCLWVVIFVFLYGEKKMWNWIGAGACYVLFKEFVYDILYEIPEQTILDGVLDMTMFFLGGGLGLLMNHFRNRRLRR